jgi:multidrug efflux pump subunit AcrA (membrane-fusion protein)
VAARALVEVKRLELEILRRGARPEDIRAAEIEVDRQRGLVAMRERLAARRRIGGTRPGRAFVGRVWVERGEWLNAGARVADLLYMDRLKVEIDLPAAEGLRVKRGAKATVRSGAFEGAALQGAVTRVAPSVDPASGTVRVVVEADNPSLKMKPGVEAEVEIVP